MPASETETRIKLASNYECVVNPKPSRPMIQFLRNQRLIVGLALTPEQVTQIADALRPSPDTTPEQPDTSADNSEPTTSEPRSETEDRVARDCPSCGRHTILREDRICNKCWLMEDRRTRVAEDVERLASMVREVKRGIAAEGHNWPTTFQILDSAADALETAQAEKAAAVVVADQRGWQIARMAGEAREKDETIARLREFVDRVEEDRRESDKVLCHVRDIRRALAEQGDEG